MKSVSLYVPKIEDLWFRQLVMSDPQSMSYNAGYAVSYDGYHYDTGCIDFPKSNWERWHKEKIENGKIFFAYIVDNETKDFVGYLNYHKDSEGKYQMGIVMYSLHQGKGYMRPALLKLIETAKKNGIDALCDSVPKSRERALKVFFDLGFEITSEFYIKKFNKDDLCYNIELKIQ